LTGARDDCRDPSLDMVSAAGVAKDFFDDFRGFVDVTGVGLGLGVGSAWERMLEKAMGSAGLLGV